MTATINTYSDVITALDYVEHSGDLVQLSMADRGEMLRMLSDRGVELDDEHKNVIFFHIEEVGFAIEVRDPFGDPYAILQLTEGNY
jgi:hypothetical protein